MARHARHVPGVLTAIILAASGATAGLADTIRILPAAGQVDQYAMLELRLDISGEIGIPRDPHAVDMHLVVKTPGRGEVLVPAFFMQDFEHRRVGREGRTRDWLYPRGEGEWRARFAPREPGEHVVTARLRTGDGESTSTPLRFLCVASNRRGFVRVSDRDPRFLEHEGGEPFFAIGQNLAFIGAGQYVTPTRAEAILEKLARHGANFVRVWTCGQDWALALEARKSAWGRSWGPTAPVAPLPGATPGSQERRCVKIEGDDGLTVVVDPSRPVALRPGTRYVVTGRIRAPDGVGVVLELGDLLRETVAGAGRAKGDGKWSPFRAEFLTGSGDRWLPRTRLRLEGAGTAWLDGLSLREAGGSAELLWEADVNRLVPGTVNQVDAFLLDTIVRAAERSGVYLQLCVLTRDLYMDSLRDPDSEDYAAAIRHAKNLLRYAVARWGASTSVVTWEYFNEMDPGRPTGPFYTALGKHLERIDPFRHLRATSTWHPSPRDWKHAELDVADEHFYLRPVEDSPYNDEVTAVLGRAAFMREHCPRRPALVSEFGLATEKWGLSPRMRQDARLVHVHNALWASALSGLSGTAMFWWWEELDRRNVYPLYRPLADFLAGIPFTCGTLGPVSATASLDRIRVIGLGDRDRADFWVFDRDAAWIGKGVEGIVPSRVTDLTVEIHGLSPGPRRIIWVDTRSGDQIAGGEAHVETGDLRLRAPEFTADVAGRVLPR